MHHRPRLRKLEVNFLLPRRPSRITGPGALGGESGFSEAIESGLNFPRSTEPLGGLSNHPTAVGVGWATFSVATEVSTATRSSSMLAHVRPRGAFLSKSQLPYSCFLRAAPASSATPFKVCFLTRALAHLFMYSLISSFTHLFPHPCISLLTF